VSMKLTNVLFSFARLATGEVLGRIATFALFAYVSRYFGVEILGIIALGQAVASYVMECSDQGLKLIGARLLARNGSLVGYLVPLIVKRRIAVTLLAILVGTTYAVFGPVPLAARVCVLAFNLAAFPYSLALDWVAWGLVWRAFHLAQRRERSLCGACHCRDALDAASDTLHLGCELRKYIPWSGIPVAGMAITLEEARHRSATRHIESCDG
jgi:hypothetical protein